MTRYTPSRSYLTAGVVAVALGAFSSWVALDWVPAIIPVVMFALSAGLLLFLSFRPAIEIDESDLLIGRRRISWSDIRRVDRTGWISPLVVYLTLSDDSRVVLLYPGDLDSSNSLLRDLRRHATESLIDGIPYRQFWGDELPVDSPKRKLESPTYRLLSPEDEADVERMYQLLKTVGHLDSSNQNDEK